MEKRVIRSLHQRYGLWRRQLLELYENEVKLVFRSGANRSSRTIPLEWIDKHDSEARLFPYGTRWAMIVSAIAAGGALAAALQWGGVWWGVLIGLGILFALLGGLYWIRAYDAFYFYNSYNGEFLFAMMKSHPSVDEVSGFVAALRKEMQSKKDRAKMESEVPSIATEIHHLSELMKKDVISDDEFTRKKEELIEDLLRD